MDLRPRQIRKLRARCPDAELAHWLDELEAFGQQAAAWRFLNWATRGAWRPIPEANLALVRQCRTVGVDPRMTRKLVLTWPERVRQQLAWLPLRQVRAGQAAGTLVKAVYRDRAAPRPRPQRMEDRPAAKPVSRPAQTAVEDPMLPEITDPVMRLLRTWWPRLCPLWRVSQATVHRDGPHAVLQVTVPHEFGRTVLAEGHEDLGRRLKEDGLPEVLAELVPGTTRHDLQITVEFGWSVDLDWTELAVDIGDAREEEDLGRWLARGQVQWADTTQTWQLTLADELTHGESTDVWLALALRMGHNGYLEVTVDETLRDVVVQDALVAELINAMEERDLDPKGTARLVARQVAHYGLDYGWEKLAVVQRIRRLQNPLGAWRQACVEDWR